jgi:AraC family transcriptional regulator of arabinose operon
VANELKKDGFIGQQYCVIPHAVLKTALTTSLCKYLYVTDIGYYPNALHHRIYRKRGCPQNVLIYCVKGSGWYEINGQRFELHGNQVVILPKKIAHSYGADDINPWTIYWLHFAGENADDLIAHLSKTVTCSPWAINMDKGRTMMFDRIQKLLEMWANMDNIIDANLLLPGYLQSFKPEVKTTRPVPDKTDTVDQSIEFMKANLSATLTLKVLAQQVSLSVSQYCTRFKQKVHASPQSYFTFLKMQHACQLLEYSNQSVRVIAVQLGFDDQFHFSRTFKKTIGTSPRKFRSRY